MICIAIILDCDWWIWVQLIPNKSAKFVTRIVQSTNVVWFTIIYWKQPTGTAMFVWFEFSLTKTTRNLWVNHHQRMFVVLSVNHFDEHYYQVIVWFLVKFGKNKHSWVFQFWRFWETHSCMFFPNCTRNHTITYTYIYNDCISIAGKTLQQVWGLQVWGFSVPIISFRVVVVASCCNLNFGQALQKQFLRVYFSVCTPVV